jgi:hypothetical protein
MFQRLPGISGGDAFLREPGIFLSAPGRDPRTIIPQGIAYWINYQGERFFSTRTACGIIM